MAKMSRDNENLMHMYNDNKKDNVKQTFICYKCISPEHKKNLMQFKFNYAAFH